MTTPSAPSLLNDRCPRCGGDFHCGARDPQGCACFGLELAPALMRELRANYEVCLCVRCLRALQDQHEQAQQQ